MKLTMVVPDLPGALNQPLEGLVRTNVALLLAAFRAGRPVPPLYQMGVRYKREPYGREWWQTLADSIIEKTADCEDLACHRTGELRFGGILAGLHDGNPLAIAAIDPNSVLFGVGPYPARAICIRTGPRTYHSLVEHPDRRREDPSRVLGMSAPKRRP